MVANRILVFVLSSMLLGCQNTQTLIETEPTGAEISIDGRPVGTSPVSCDLRKFTGGSANMLTAISEFGSCSVLLTPGVVLDTGDYPWPREIQLILKPKESLPISSP